ncbi:MAG: hypothetical protein ACTH5B_05475 [Marinomonas sp.]|uniref:hypothetical protein n=1 Tax=Marinomonas sp. TaxID=1904862 RepID=UPI003F94DE08
MKDDVCLLFDEEQTKKLSPSLDSIFENQDFSRFHYGEIQRLIEEHMKDKKSAKDYMRLVITNDVDVLNAEHEFKTGCRAHIFALLKNLHSITDFLAHVLYFSFGLDRLKTTEIAPKKLNLYTVKDKMKKHFNTPRLLGLIERLTSNSDYEYLRDIVNHSKHRSNIMSQLTYDSLKQGKDIYLLSIFAFSIDGKSYNARDVSDFLNSEYDRQSELVIEIGNEINKTVTNMLANHPQ